MKKCGLLQVRWKNCRFLCNLSILSISEFFFYRVGNLEYTAVYKVLNHIQTAPVLISYPGILLGIFDVGLLRGLGNPHPVSDHNVKTDK